MNVAHVIANRYELGDFIRQGAIGAVYRGRDQQTSQQVAIKRLKHEVISDDPDIIKRFAREGDTLRALDHPNIVKLLASVQEGDQYYLIMEYVGGGSLADVLYAQGALPVPRVLSIGLELADALARAHHLNIIHRDIKPGNVLLAEDGTPRLTDFGAAHVSGSQITQTGIVVGTYAYLSPELLDTGQFDARADIWALGIMLYEMLAGRRPFEADVTAALVTAILTKPPPDLEVLRPDTPVGLVDLIYRMLEKDPNQRIGRMRLVGAELEAIRGGKTQRTASIARLPITSTMITPAKVLDNLPAQTTPFVGRETELTELTRLLTDPSIRLLTLLGPGGIGKSRLSIEVGGALRSEFADGVYFISLAPLVTPGQILPAIAEVIRFSAFRGGDPKQQLFGFLHGRSMLLILDNFEHLLAGAPLVTEMLHAAPALKIIATSRELLHLEGETAFRIEGMDFPASATAAARADYGAVKLFLQRARHARPAYLATADDLIEIVRICHLVEGMPLAILLAAASIDVLPLIDIANEIAHNLDFLATEQRDMPLRQRSIRAAFDYSWNLLTTDERAAFARLSMFRGGFTREAAHAVAGATLRILTLLVNKSLLRRSPAGRYEIHELLRQYAEIKLGSAPDATTAKAAAETAHAAYYIGFLEQQITRLKGAEQLESLKALEVESDNVRAAWHWAATHADIPAIRCAWQGLWLFCIYLTRLQYAGEAFEQAVECLRANGPSEPDSALFACVLGLQAIAANHIGGGLQLGEQRQESYRRLKGFGAGSELAFVTLYNVEDRFDDKQRLYQECLAIFESLGDVWGMAMSYTHLGQVVGNQGLFTEAKGYYRQGLALATTAQARLQQAYTMYGLGWVHWHLGEYGEALLRMEEAQKIFREFGAFSDLSNCLAYLGAITFRLTGDVSRANQYFDEGLSIARKIGDRWNMIGVLTHMGWLEREQERHSAAKQNFQEALTLSRSLGDRAWIADALNNLGHASTGLGQHTEADGYFREALQLAVEASATPYALESLTGIASLIGQSPEQERAIELLTLALHHPANVAKVRQMDEAYLAELEAHVSPERFAAAQERGKLLVFDSVVKEILGSS